MIQKPKELWDKKLNDLFKKKSPTETEIFLNIVSMIVYNNLKNDDLSKLYSTLDLENFIKVVSLFEARTIEFPTKKELQEAIELAIIYYYKKVHLYSYEQLKNLPIFKDKDFSTISVGKKLSKIQKEIISKLDNLENLFDFEGDENE